MHMRSDINVTLASAALCLRMHIHICTCVNIFYTYTYVSRRDSTPTSRAASCKLHSWALSLRMYICIYMRKYIIYIHTCKYKRFKTNVTAAPCEFSVRVCTYMCVCTYPCVCTYLCVCVYILCTYTNVSTKIYVWTAPCEFSSTALYLCVHVHFYTRGCHIIWMHLSTYIHHLFVITCAGCTVRLFFGGAVCVCIYLHVRV